MRLLWTYLEHHGRPVAFYTDKASLFQTAPKTARDPQELPRDEREPLPPTQIGRALRELGIVWIAAHSPQAKGRVERSFQTAQDRLVKGLRVAEPRPWSRPIAIWRGVSAVVESASGGGASQPHRCPSATGRRARSGRLAQPGGDPPGRPTTTPFASMPSSTRSRAKHSHRIAWRQRAHRDAPGWYLARALSAASICEPVPGAPKQKADPPRRSRRPQPATAHRSHAGSPWTPVPDTPATFRCGRRPRSIAPAPPTRWKNESGAPGKTGPAIFALTLSEDRCSGASPKQIRPQKPKPPERATYGPV